MFVNKVEQLLVAILKLVMLDKTGFAPIWNDF